MQRLRDKFWYYFWLFYGLYWLELQFPAEERQWR